MTNQTVTHQRRIAPTSNQAARGLAARLVLIYNEKEPTIDDLHDACDSLVLLSTITVELMRAHLHAQQAKAAASALNLRLSE